MEFDYRTSTVLGKQTLERHKQIIVCTRTQEKRALILQETEPDLPVSVWESLAEVWVDIGLPQARDTECNSPGMCNMLA